MDAWTALLAPAAATPRQGRLALLACGACWAAFCLALDLAGHAPTRAPLPRWYLLQAVLLVPWLQLCGAVYAWLAGRIARADLRGPLGVSLGLPLLLGFVLPDMAIAATLGFDALWPAMLGYGALTVAWSLGAGVAATRRAAGLSTARALAAVVPAWLLQAVLASLLLR